MDKDTRANIESLMKPGGSSQRESLNVERAKVYILLEIADSLDRLVEVQRAGKAGLRLSK